MRYLTGDIRQLMANTAEYAQHINISCNGEFMVFDTEKVCTKILPECKHLPDRICYYVHRDINGPDVVIQTYIPETHPYFNYDIFYWGLDICEDKRTSFEQIVRHHTKYGSIIFNEIYNNENNSTDIATV